MVVTLPDLPTLAWLVLALLGAATIMALTRSLAGSVLVHTDLHDLALEVQRLREAHERMLAALRAPALTDEPVDDEPNVDIIDDAPAPIPVSAEPATPEPVAAAA